LSSKEFIERRLPRRGVTVGRLPPFQAAAMRYRFA
jgi:hypothetical protein